MIMISSPPNKKGKGSELILHQRIKCLLSQRFLARAALQIFSQLTEIFGESSCQIFLSADKKRPGLNSDFTLRDKMLVEPEIFGESSSPTLLSADKKGPGLKSDFLN
jgi:hypothetical protein